MEKLRKLYPTLGDPTDTAFSGWNADRFARGAYSFPGVGSVIQDYDTMAAQEGLLHFAGEHTTRTWGSVNGAFESGKDAAQEILSAKQGLKNTSGSRRPAERTDKSQENLGKPGFSYLFR
jgi:monoamine oxidase